MSAMIEPLVAQSMPPIDGQYFLLLSSRVLHILASIVLVGGLFYLRMIVAPRLRASDSTSDADPWFAGRRGAWAMWVGIATLLLIVTGLFNFIVNVKTYEINTSYHMMVGLKILAAVVVFFLAAVLAGRSGLAERLRHNMKFWLSACLLTAILVVIIGSVMRTYPREPKSENGPILVAPSN
jgi:uncharacterized membrane protein